MAIHRSVVSLLNESLPEFVAIAKYALENKKPDGGFYGYPGAVLLLAVADAIGSYYRRNSNFVVTIDGKERSIAGDRYRHFFVFNSDLYGCQDLSEAEVKCVYEMFRNPLTHNAAMAPGVLLNAGDPDGPTFYPRDGGIDCINVVGLLKITETAVVRFLKTGDTVVTDSEQAQHLMRRKGTPA